MRKLHRIYHYLRTAVRVELYGTNPQRFLSLCAQAEIEIWSIEFVEENRLRVSVQVRDFRRAARFVRRCGCRMKIVSRSGAHYGAKKLVRHGILAIFLAAFAALSLWINSHVLSFTFTGYETVTPREIMEAMEKYGLGFGTRKKSVDASDLRNRILLEIPELIWFTVTFHGSHASVDVRERVPVPQITDESTPADIVSDVHGIVCDMSVYKGEGLVKKGDVIVPGQTLVSGYVELRNPGRTLLVHARADVYADVWYKTTLAMPLDCPTKCPTGRTAERWALIFGKKRINFYKNDGKVFDNYDKLVSRYTLPGADALPVVLVRETYIEYETYCTPRSAGDLAADLTASARRMTLARDVGVELTGASAREGEGVLYAYAYGKCRRKIGLTVMRE